MRAQRALRGSKYLTRVKTPCSEIDSMNAGVRDCVWMGLITTTKAAKTSRDYAGWGSSGNRGEAIERHRSEEHTSELQSHLNLVCRLLLEKKKTASYPRTTPATR